MMGEITLPPQKTNEERRWEAYAQWSAAHRSGYATAAEIDDLWERYHRARDIHLEELGIFTPKKRFFD